MKKRTVSKCRSNSKITDLIVPNSPISPIQKLRKNNNSILSNITFAGYEDAGVPDEDEEEKDEEEGDEEEGDDEEGDIEEGDDEEKEDQVEPRVPNRSANKLLIKDDDHREEENKKLLEQSRSRSFVRLSEIRMQK